MGYVSGKRWTEPEVQALRDYYEKGGSALCIKHCPKMGERSARSICTKARDMKLSVTKEARSEIVSRQMSGVWKEKGDQIIERRRAKRRMNIDTHRLYGMGWGY